LKGKILRVLWLVLLSSAPIPLIAADEDSGDKTVVIKNLGVGLPGLTKFALCERNDGFGKKNFAGGYIMLGEKQGGEVEFKIHKNLSLADWEDGGEYYLWIYTDFPYLSFNEKENPDITKDKPAYVSKEKLDFTQNKIIIDWKEFKEPGW